MLINFSVANFRSFGAEQTLNLVASGKLKDHMDHCVPLTGDQKVLRSAVVYGANGAGKSNLVKAMDFAHDLILGRRSTKAVQFNLSRMLEASPMEFEFRYLVKEQIFVYGFSIEQDGVIEEWLSASTDKRNENEIFTRKAQEITIGNLDLFESDGDISRQKLEALQQLGVRQDQLLLNKVVELDKNHRGEVLHRAVWWFQDCLMIVLPDTTFGPLLEFMDRKSDFRRFASEFLSKVGTGINQLHVKKEKVAADKVHPNLLKRLQSAKNENEVDSIFPGTSIRYQLDPEDPSMLLRKNLTSSHGEGGINFTLPFHEESDGTRRCLELLPALYSLTKRCQVFVIDEMDRSMHPLLSYAFLKFFVESCPGFCRQMIVTTHTTHLLDLELLRRDEIWFVEKNEAQQTTLFPLDDLNVRNDVRIEKGYLQGRFGGVPFIADHKQLMDLLECSQEKESGETESSPR